MRLLEHWCLGLEVILSWNRRKPSSRILLVRNAHAKPIHSPVQKLMRSSFRLFVWNNRKFSKYFQIVVNLLKTPFYFLLENAQYRNFSISIKNVPDYFVQLCKQLTNETILSLHATLQFGKYIQNTPIHWPFSIRNPLIFGTIPLFRTGLPWEYCPVPTNARRPNMHHIYHTIDDLARVGRKPMGRIKWHSLNVIMSSKASNIQNKWLA